MIKIENTVIRGWEAAIRGMRNPLNSWDKSDSIIDCPDCNLCPNSGTNNCNVLDCCVIGKNDLDLMKRLCNAGTDHRKFMRMIAVYVDVTAPLYWWTEMDTYKVGTVRNSCSKMHTIHKKEFTLEDFSHEHIKDIYPRKHLENTINILNDYRKRYLKTKDKADWWYLIQMLPQTYNQKATLMLNYEVLANIYKSRKNHKLDEWHDFCDWIKALPYSELITGEDNGTSDI